MSKDIGKKVLIGLSGGVDSSVSAYLLQKQGYDVTGVYLKAWDEALGADGKASCPWQDDIADARRVAAFLGIPFSVIDVKEAYNFKVVEFLKQEYSQGRTPNPDILCNREMKFGIMLQVARELEFDYIATGHYARTSEIQNPKTENLNKYQIQNSKSKTHQLLRGVDDKKDQTYFLWTLTQDDLQMTLFPLGDKTKSEIRAIAHNANLPVADKKDSQGICFLGPINLREFLKRELKVKSGNVLDEKGSVIGKHDGASLYTIGQRHGFSITAFAGEIYYVVDKNIKDNTITVSKKIPTSKTLTATNLNWIGNEPPNVGDSLELRIRHGQHPQIAKVTSLASKSIKVSLEKPIEAVAVGQSVVFSKKEVVLGGGVIV